MLTKVQLHTFALQEHDSAIKTGEVGKRTTAIDGGDAQSPFPTSNIVMLHTDFSCDTESIFPGHKLVLAESDDGS